MPGRSGVARPRFATRSARTFPVLVASLVPTLFLVTGCGGDAGARGLNAFSLGDSAGVVIASNAGGVAGADGVAGWEAREVLRIGSIDGPAETLFDRPGAIVPDGEGGIFIVEASENAIRRYASDGSFLGRIGGEGDGPGEFRGLQQGLSGVGDTLVSFDARLRRMTRYLTTGDLIDTRPVELNFVEQGIPTLLHPIGDGRFLGLSHAGCSLPAPDDRRARVRLSVLAPDSGEGSRVIVTGPVTSWFVFDIIAIYGPGGAFCSFVPSLAGHGAPYAVRSDGLWALAPGPEYEIHLIRPPTDPTDREAWSAGPLGTFPAPERIIRAPHRPDPVTPAQERGYRERWGGDLRGDGPRVVEAMHAAWDTMSVPTHYPAIQHLHWDDDGRLWVHRRGPWSPTMPEHFDMGPGPWDIYDREGRHIAVLSLPDDVAVSIIHADRIWGIVRDELEVPALVAFDIVR